MDDADLVGGVEPARDLLDEVELALERELREHLRERDAEDRLEDQVVEAVARARLVDRDDVRVAHAREGLGLAAQALDLLVGSLLSLAEELQGHGAARLGVERVENDAVRPAAELPADHEPTEGAGLAALHAPRMTAGARPRERRASGRSVATALELDSGESWIPAPPSSRSSPHEGSASRSSARP